VSNHLVSTAATLARCRGCGAQVLHGYAEGLLVFADLAPIPPAAADALTAAGWLVYVLTYSELVHRDDTRTQLAGVLLAEHRCPKEIPR
jgi:hypothetical protein